METKSKRTPTLKKNQNKPTPTRGAPKGTSKPANSGRKKATFEGEITKALDLAKKERKLYVEFSATLFLDILTDLTMPEPDTKRFKTLSGVLNGNRDKYPTMAAFLGWLRRDTSGELEKMYHEVMEANIQLMHDERFRVAYDIEHDIMMTERNGTFTPEWNKLFVQRGKVIIDALEWSLTRLAPAKYGNNLKVETTIEASTETLKLLAQDGAARRAAAFEAAERLAKELYEQQSGKSQDA
ncbi:hypothetical protein ADP71_17780 [Vitreoscilla sp. C1]|uniref:terminase small subunit-like protein n=1 Tax=Vitreoscilla sp. (strain C1) TaxID=96942 RepID=UPI00148EAD34|nr:hypothetical protein [Vitreoscilla sp. C1]AUZ05303.2 hypothetical protein ADP71_17780 [Vitreoscilla sp. C1]